MSNVRGEQCILANKIDKKKDLSVRDQIVADMTRAIEDLALTVMVLIVDEV